MRPFLFAALGLLTACGDQAAVSPVVDFVAEANSCFANKQGEDCAAVSLYYTPRRWRAEWIIAGKRTTHIFDAGERTFTTIRHAEKQFYVDRFDAVRDTALAPFLPPLLLGERVGEETVGGRRTVKYRFALSGRSGETPSETSRWLTAENIVVRSESTAHPKGDVWITRMEATRLAIGPVSATQLDSPIPPDFRRVDALK